MVFLAALFGWHDAGVANEWEKSLPVEDEQRWQELDKKRRELQKEGKVLPAHEYDEWLALEKRKYPYGRGPNTERPVAKDPKTRFPKAGKHHGKHAEEWEPPLTEEEYYERAEDLADAPVGGSVLGFTSEEGYTFRYNDETGEFLTMKPDGTIETLFKPERGKEYYLDQLSKYGK